MSLGTIVIDERVLPIENIFLGEGSIQLRVRFGYEDLQHIPAGPMDYSVHAPDGSFVVRGRADMEHPLHLGPLDSGYVTILLSINDKLSDGLRPIPPPRKKGRRR